MTARLAVHYERPTCSDHGRYLDGGHACQTADAECRVCGDVAIAVEPGTGEGACATHLPEGASIA